MNVSENALKNTVSSKNQLEESKYVNIIDNGADLKVLFIGNSITKHGPSAPIGWHGNWGMAASCEENDFVHKTVKGLEERYGKVNYCVAQLAEWERCYTETDDVIGQYYRRAVEFGADIVIVRIGENINRDRNKEISCKPYFKQMIKAFVKNADTRVIVTDTFWEIEVLDVMIKEICDEDGYTFCKISDLEQDKSNMAIGLFEHEGVAAHPSDKGMQAIADRILEKIQEK